MICVFGLIVILVISGLLYFLKDFLYFWETKEDISDENIPDNIEDSSSNSHHIVMKEPTNEPLKNISVSDGNIKIWDIPKN